MGFSRALKTIDTGTSLLAEWDAKIDVYDTELAFRNESITGRKMPTDVKKEGQLPNPKRTEPNQEPVIDRNDPGASFKGMIAPCTNKAM